MLQTMCDKTTIKPLTVKGCVLRKRGPTGDRGGPQAPPSLRFSVNSCTEAPFLPWRTSPPGLACPPGPNHSHSYRAQPLPASHTHTHARTRAHRHTSRTCPSSQQLSPAASSPSSATVILHLDPSGFCLDSPSGPGPSTDSQLSRIV